MPAKHLTVSNSGAAILPLTIEPWGRDYWVQAGEGLELFPEDPAESFYFAVVHGADSIEVYAEGGCSNVRVEHNGQLIPCGHQRPEN